MNMANLIEKLQALPEDKQLEVFDFIDYLSSRFGVQPSPTEWSEQAFSALSMTQAMRGLENEPDVYKATDITERWP